jgi:uncharacterized membrane protein YcfT
MSEANAFRALSFVSVGIYFVVFLGGLVATLVLWRRLGRAAPFALLGMAIKLVLTIGSPIFTVVALRAASGTDEILKIQGLISLVGAVFGAAGYLCLFVAIFVRRDGLIEPGR